MIRRGKTAPLTCVTYNVLRGLYADLVVENVRALIGNGADVICLQETEPRFAQRLDVLLQEPALAKWAVEYAHAERGGHMAILWNTKRLSLKKSEVFLLPTLGRPSHLQRIYGRPSVYQRLALIAEFTCGEHALTISNVHLAWEGGMRHRFRQVRALRTALEARADAPMIVCGDFNTIGPRLINTLQGARARHLLGPGFFDAHPKLRWSFDISYIDPESWRGGVAHLRRMGVRLRSRLDYMFARNLRPVSADMHDLPGSDHRPLTATFELPPRARRS